MGRRQCSLQGLPAHREGSSAGVQADPLEEQLPSAINGSLSKHNSNQIKITLSARSALTAHGNGAIRIKKACDTKNGTGEGKE